jgi:hypothetical protein
MLHRRHHKRVQKTIGQSEADSAQMAAEFARRFMPGRIADEMGACAALSTEDALIYDKMAQMKRDRIF